MDGDTEETSSTSVNVSGNQDTSTSLEVSSRAAMDSGYSSVFEGKPYDGKAPDNDSQLEVSELDSDTLSLHLDTSLATEPHSIEGDITSESPETDQLPSDKPVAKGSVQETPGNAEDKSDKPEESQINIDKSVVTEAATEPPMEEKEELADVEVTCSTNKITKESDTVDKTNAEDDKAEPMDMDFHLNKSQSGSKDGKAAEKDNKGETQNTNNIEYVEMGSDGEAEKTDSTVIDSAEASSENLIENENNSEDNSANNEHRKDPFDGVTEAKEDGEKDARGNAKDARKDQDPMATEDAPSEGAAPAEENAPIDEIVENPEGADEELCIIPDTDRVISQDEPAFPLPELTEATDSTEVIASGSSVQATQPQVLLDQFVVTKLNTEELKSCVQCVLQRKNKFTVRKGKDTTYVCSDTCLDNFKKANEGNVFLNWDKEIRVKNFTSVIDRDSSQQSQVAYERKCVVCKKKTDDEENNLTWEIMDFCNEFCLSKYQKEIGSVCSSCMTEVRPNSLGKYCVRFGNDIRQFCSSHCLEEYKKGLKVCSYCQQDMSKEGDGFLAPVGDKGQFKDFCSQNCMKKYDMMTNKRPPQVPTTSRCSVCKTDTITIEYETDSGMEYFCSERCFIAYSFVANITPTKCNLCKRPFRNEVLQKNTMYYDNVQYSFCSNSCQNIYIVAHRKIVPCVWCKVKKYNFDMIRRYFKTGPVLNMCSINCLNLFQVSVNAVQSKTTICNYCNKRHQPMYHITMSDATIRNFCSCECVMSFQNRFKKSSKSLSSADLTSGINSVPVPAGEPKTNRKYPVSEAGKATPSLPIISSVHSLSSNKVDYTTSPQPTSSRPGPRSKVNPGTPQLLVNSTVQREPKIKIKHHLIVKPAPVPDQRNVATMCKLRTHNKATTMKPIFLEKDAQTEEREAKKILIPIPVPIFIPAPLPMFTVPTPFPLPFALPIPVPVFIPTTRNSAKGIMKEIKKIQVKIPTDPYEAELLMMAEMVAGDKKDDNTDSESDVDDAPGADEGGSFSSESVDASNTFGEDMLQMALKMATELEEPAVDLEGALTANTITAPPGGAGEPQNKDAVDDPQPMLIAERQQAAFRGRKRAPRGSKQASPSKRRRMSQPVEMPVMPPQPAPPPEPAEKPDAHLCLKYTFGVNAWKQWVTTKNGELEKSAKYAKPFKTEILQLTSDELNYSLCLFVKEVRKPNGAEYAPDTIYYLCLGIQQYLFENGRIDNIFCDPYYEQFTDALDEVARRFSVLYNDSHYIVTRVEEEHLWESKQLGAHSPHVLLSTLMFFNTKHFNLTTVQEHMQLSFSHIMKHWKRNPNQAGVARVPGSRNVLLRFYPPQSAVQSNSRKKKVYEQQENDENPLRCPVKLYEFYLSKCPESVKTRNDVFYLQPERSCVPDSPVWYSTTALPQEALEKMLHRVKMVKEINVALLTS